MDNVVSDLTTSLSATNLWGVVGSTVPLIAIVTLFALGFYLVRTLLKKVAKHKSGN